MKTSALTAIISAVDRMSPTLKRITQNLNHMRLTALTVGGGFRTAALWAGGGSLAGAYVFKKQFIESAASLERLRIQMNGVMGDAAKGREAVAWVQKFAEATQLQTAGAADAFMLLKNAGMDPVNGTLQAIVDQAARVGRGQEQVMGVTLALTQAWQKQKLQGEEIMQLNERLIPVWDILAKGTGKTVPQLQKLAEKGALGRKVITGLIEAIGKMNAGAAAEAGKTWDGILSTFEDRWGTTKNSIMDAGPFDWLKARLVRANNFMGALGSPENQAKLARIGKSLERSFNAAERIVTRIDLERFAKMIERTGAAVDGLGHAWDRVEDEWIPDIQRILDRITGMFDDELEAWAKSIRYFSPILPNSWIEGTSRLLADIDKRRSRGRYPYGIDLSGMLMAPGQLKGLPQLGKQTADFAGLAEKYGAINRIRPELIRSLIREESSGDPRAESPKGAMGLMQLMPGTASRYGAADPFDPEQNVRAGAAYMRWLLDRYGGNEAVAVAAYNAGEKNVDAYRGVPPFRETRDFVRRVMQGAGAAPGRVEGDIRVRFENAPPGTRVDPGRRSGPVSISPSVGYRSFATGKP